MIAAGPAHRVSPVPIALRLHTAGYQQAAGGYGGEADNVMTRVETSPNIRAGYGEEFDDCVTWVELLMGPNWRRESTVELFADHSFKNGWPDRFTAPQDVNFAGTFFNHRLTSVRINP